jgi:hypothetical protein
MTLHGKLLVKKEPDTRVEKYETTEIDQIRSSQLIVERCLSTFN